MPRPASADSFLPLKSDVLLILLALASGPLHGYGIIREVEERSAGEVLLQTGALYRTLRRLLNDDLIEEGETPPEAAAAPSSDERRRYYRLTRLGRNVLDAEVNRMSRLVRAARLIHAGKKPKLI
jgi:DNA-binding PadR family transcriptional regulator